MHSARFRLVRVDAVGAGEVNGAEAGGAAGVLVETVKLADEGTGDVIVRLYESLGRRQHFVLHAHFAHHGVVPTDLLENPTDELVVGDFTATVRPFELITLRFTR